MALNPGRLRHRVLVEQRVQATETALLEPAARVVGEPLAFARASGAVAIPASGLPEQFIGVGLMTIFAPVAETWADIQAVKGAVYAAGLQVGEGPTHRIVMRWRDPVAFDHVSRGAQRWRVRDARDPDGRRQVLEVMAEELNPA